MTEEEQKRIFSQNLNYYIANSGKQQKEIAQALGYSVTTFNTWCVGKIIPSAGKIQKIADYFHIGKSDLLDDKTNIMGKPHSSGIIIPVLGRVAAGIPIEAVENIIDTEEISQSMALDGEYFGLQIKGDSMEPKISNGDIVIVRKQSDADDGDLVIALVNGNDAVCKRLKKYDDGIALLSTNPAYQPMYFSSKEVSEKPISIVGKVKELRAKF